MDYLKTIQEKLAKKFPQKNTEWQAQEAERILREPMIQEFMNQYPVYLHNQWCNSADPIQREDIHRLYQCFKRFEQHFEMFITKNKIQG